MAKPEGKVIANCSKCGKPVGEQHSYTWCSECGEPLTSETLAKLRQQTPQTPVQSAAMTIPQSPQVPQGVANSSIVYDPDIIKRFASELYAQAAWVVITHALMGIALGGGVGFMLYRDIGAALGALVAGFCGYGIGQSKAFVFRLQAQTALCQVAIEANTRS